jgi:hypothetical protein
LKYRTLATSLPPSRGSVNRPGWIIYIFTSFGHRFADLLCALLLPAGACNKYIYIYICVCVCVCVCVNSKRWGRKNESVCAWRQKVDDADADSCYHARWPHKVRKEMLKSVRYYVECDSGSLLPTSSLLKEKRTIH